MSFLLAPSRGRSSIKRKRCRIGKVIGTVGKRLMDARRPKIRALVVDDSITSLRSLCRFLRFQPNLDVVGTAMDGCEALASAVALHPDLVLLDVQMPVMNGIEAAALLRHDFPGMRIIMVTVHDRPEVRQACHEAGADGFLAKEHIDDELPSLIEHVFASERSGV